MCLCVCVCVWVCVSYRHKADHAMGFYVTQTSEGLTLCRDVLIADCTDAWCPADCNNGHLVPS